MREFNRIEPIESLYRLKQNKKKIVEAELLRRSSASTITSGEKLADFVCYSLLPNHYHFILKQKREKGIPKLLHKIGTSYTKYFNYKNSRSGSLFQGRYKAKHITSDSYLWWLSCYVNANAEIHKITKAEKWIWSSCQDYLGLRDGTICDKNIVLKSFKNIKEYKSLINTVVRESLKSKKALELLECN